MHHEKLVFFPKDNPATADDEGGGIKPFNHQPDRDWDAVRSQSVAALKRQCSYRRYIYHPGADGPYQGFDNSGYIARISLHPREEGGCAGQ
ncbi:hypothetical protein GKE82_26205 [Conexibacter sp. W3-3-2]|uniref:hypothetical protein n=1 Tax=Conexibacter sp. W3-3-2 TaxID=2675227 RepID=UPI0012B91A3E|nr:hypothetical protein [Conexibacter sp. W3-3-2]MTD47614.1 hypothetical protein [Conexibacter sp. W3-3-2]MTD47699.1 hypothetical protein [Conexibacter sp. W3-3-2]